jgi:hypothetical protein
MVVYPGSAFTIFFCQGQTDKIDRQDDIKTDRQTDGKKNRQDRKPDRQTDDTQMTGGQTAEGRTGRQKVLRVRKRSNLSDRQANRTQKAEFIFPLSIVS